MLITASIHELSQGAEKQLVLPRTFLGMMVISIVHQKKYEE